MKFNKRGSINAKYVKILKYKLILFQNFLRITKEDRVEIMNGKQLRYYETKYTSVL